MPSGSWRYEAMKSDETRWMAAAIEILTLISVLIFALARSQA